MGWQPTMILRLSQFDAESVVNGIASTPPHSSVWFFSCGGYRVPLFQLKTYIAAQLVVEGWYGELRWSIRWGPTVVMKGKSTRPALARMWCAGMVGIQEVQLANDTVWFCGNHLHGRKEPCIVE